MFETSPRAVFIAVAVIASLVGAAFLRDGAKIEKSPSFDTPLISASTRTFIGATLLFVAFVVLVTWVFNPRT